MVDPYAHSLADFIFGDDDDVLHPPEGFTTWMNGSQRPISLFEPRMHGAVRPRMIIERGGEKREVINLSSYNYLGLATHPEVIAAAGAALEEYGTGACGSPILSGLSDLHRALERRLADYTGREDTMLFNSGFAGGLGSLSGLLRKGDVAILDNKCHLCLLDGARLSKARVVVFDHNDPKSLDEMLTRYEGRRRLVVVEGVYSMDGDVAHLDKLVPVAESHGVGMFIDEAHSFGVYGANGRGVVEHYDVSDRVALQFATFSKSFAAIGGFTAGPRDLLRYMRFYTNPYGFSCALPPSVIGGLLKALEVSTRDNSLRETLWENTHYLREQLLGLGLDLADSESQVIPIVIGSDRSKLYELALDMNSAGLFLAPVDYPSVPEDGLRYRVAVTAAHTRKDLDDALTIIEDTLVPYVRSVR